MPRAQLLRISRRRWRRQRFSSRTERRSRYSSRLSSPLAKRRSSTSIPVSRPSPVQGERPLRARSRNTIPTMSTTQNSGPDRPHHPPTRAVRDVESSVRIIRGFLLVLACASAGSLEEPTLTLGGTGVHPAFPLRAQGHRGGGGSFTQY